MYLLINNTQYPVTKRIVTGDTVKYLSVSPDPRPVSGPCKQATVYTPEEYAQAWEAV